VPENIVFTVAAVRSLAGALISFWVSRRVTQNTRAASAESLAVWFRQLVIQATSTSKPGCITSTDRTRSGEPWESCTRPSPSLSMAYRAESALVAALRNDDFNRWLVRLREDISALAKVPDIHRERLVSAQHALVGLIQVLDPSGDRVPLTLRERL
jgi:hypothetical protein